MASAFGLHLGATTASLSICKDGKAAVLANDAGERVTPAVVAFTNFDQAVGQAAKQGSLRNAANTIHAVYQVLGKPWSDPSVQAVCNNCAVKMVNNNGEVAYEVQFKEKTTTFTARSIAKMIFKDMLSIADSHGSNGQSHDSVLSVPIYFTEEQKKAVRSAAQEAGFNVLRVIRDPAAALMAYDIGQHSPNESCKVVVFKMGGTTLDVTVMAVISGMYKILASKYLTSLGGDQLDQIIMKQFAEDFKRQHKLDCMENRKSRQKLQNAAEHCKRIVSKLTEAQSYIESLFEGVDFQCKLTRGRFEALASNFLQQCMEPITAALEEAGLTQDDISKIIVCGGSTKIPLLQKKIQSIFPSAEFLNTLPADEVLAVGSSKEAAILSSYDPEELTYAENATYLPSLPHNISIQTPSGPVEVVPQFSAVPLRKQLKFSLQPEQTSVLFQILVGETTVGQIALDNVTAGSCLTATFHVRSDGSLHVTCSDSDGHSQDLTVASNESEAQSDQQRTP